MRPQRSYPLIAHNTLALPATAEFFQAVQSLQALRQSLTWAQQRGQRVTVLGQGSNVVLSGQLDGLVIAMQIQGCEVLASDDDSVLLRVAAGHNWHQLVKYCVHQGYYGLENLALIPGTVGAAPVQNIGAYGVELAQFVEAVHVVHLHDLSDEVLNPAACEFAYRESVFKSQLRDRCVVTAVDLRLSKNARANIQYPALQDYLQQRGVDRSTARQVFDAVVAIRQAKLPDPEQEPNAGSFFKNPVVTPDKFQQLQSHYPDIPYYPQDNGDYKIPAAWLIERAQWKGCRQGDVGMHPNHALVLVNYARATGEQVQAFAAQIVSSVEQGFGISLEQEPRSYGTAP